MALKIILSDVCTHMISKIAIEITDRAFLPESYAYREYFLSHGFVCDFVRKGDPEIMRYDAVLLFHGFHPFWHKYPRVVIGEYHSLSVGKFSRLKDFVKRTLNVRADITIFLNNFVREKMWCRSDANNIIRGMGFDGKSFNKVEPKFKRFDIVYAGTMRSGVWEYIQKFLDLGCSVAVVGNEKSYRKDKLVCFGRVPPDVARSVISESMYGLNYTPDMFPLNVQDSTKIIEYCAAGIGVITNRYQWVDEFEMVNKARFMDLGAVHKYEDILDFDFLVPDISHLEWSTLMARTNLAKIIENME